MKIFAHRGASGYAPENTMAAFKLAHEMGADGIELDIQLTADNVLAVIHDYDIKRTSNGEGIVREKTFDELKKYDYGSWYGEKFTGTSISTLSEVLDWLKTTDMTLNIEMKTIPSLYTAEYAGLVWDAIKDSGLCERLIISSFHHQALADIRKLSTDIKTAPLYMSGLLMPEEYCKMFSFDCIHPFFEVINEQVVKDCHKEGIEVNVWTVNKKSDALTMQDLGVDSVITNYPDIMVK